MKLLRTIILLVVLLISATWGRDYLGRRTERQYFAGIAAQVHEGMSNAEAVEAMNAWIASHPQRGVSIPPLDSPASSREHLSDFVLDGSHRCSLKVKFEDGKVAEIIQSGF